MRVAVKGGRLAPFKAEAMTLFDYRTDHLEGTDMLADAEARPSFVMISRASPVYLPYISRVSPVYLAYLSRT